jgi:hypothetical protein
MCSIKCAFVGENNFDMIYYLHQHIVEKLITDMVHNPKIISLAFPLNIRHIEKRSSKFPIC